MGSAPGECLIAGGVARPLFFTIRRTFGSNVALAGALTAFGEKVERSTAKAEYSHKRYHRKLVLVAPPAGGRWRSRGLCDGWWRFC